MRKLILATVFLIGCGGSRTGLDVCNELCATYDRCGFITMASERTQCAKGCKMAYSGCTNDADIIAVWDSCSKACSKINPQDCPLPACE